MFAARKINLFPSKTLKFEPFVSGKFTCVSYFTIIQVITARFVINLCGSTAEFLTLRTMV